MATDHVQLSDVVLRTEMENDDFDEDEEDQIWEDWNADDDEEEGDDNSEILCLFCDSRYSSCSSLFEHCASVHSFDFDSIKQMYNLDFYACFKLINYIRSQVVETKCWCCGVTCKSKQDLQDHLHNFSIFEDNVLPWNDDKYLRPFMLDDPLLYSFGDDDVGEDDHSMPVDKNELLRDLNCVERACIDNKGATEQCAAEFRTCRENGDEEASAHERVLDGDYRLERLEDKDLNGGYKGVLSSRQLNDKQINLSSANVVANEIKKVNKNYFDSYSSFAIHREMICDKVRTDAYRRAVLDNPSLLRDAVIMDVGCGTGILSLFAAQAGASRVIAVEASEKMASVAAQIAKDNGLLRGGSTMEDNNHTGIVEVVQSMVEDLDNFQHIPPHSIDVLLSEWMGYCLLYESMLSSVLFARDRWLKPGGAVLPDTATMFVAGFGRGGTSLPFWENVYGFDMSCIGKEVTEDASRIPIVDVIDGCDIVTNTAVLQTFDLVTMTFDEMDFTAKVSLEPKLDMSTPLRESESEMTNCQGVVVWFETGFTRRFCKEMPTILSTSPYTPKTHWSQTILTFQEPIAIASENHSAHRLGSVGTDACPAAKICSRISIVRAAQHRSIDISMELTAIGFDGQRRNWPVQLFNLS